MSQREIIRAIIQDELSSQRFSDWIFGNDINGKFTSLDKKYEDKIYQLQLRIPEYVNSSLSNNREIEKQFNSIKNKSLTRAEIDINNLFNSHLNKIRHEISNHNITKQQISIIENNLRDEFNEHFSRGLCLGFLSTLTIVGIIMVAKQK